MRHRVLAVALAAVAALAAAVSMAFADGSRPQRAATAITCKAYRLPVEHRGTEQHVFAELCHRGMVRARTPVQVLLHGGGYDHRYWDWPYRPEKYSYVEYATKRGFATLNLDRLGYGASDHPDGASLDFAAGGRVVHQVVEKLRDGALGPRFETVVLNGHSMGGIVAERAAAYGGVDAVIVSGIPLNADGEPEEGDPDDGDEPGDEDSDDGDEGLYPFTPAVKDPRFAGLPWAKGYFTTLPGSRTQVFHYPGTYESAIARGEESAKDTLSSGELCSLRPCADAAADDQDRRSRVDVPVLHVLGRHDMLFCRTTKDCATDPGAGEVKHLIPNAGHSINLSKGAPQFYRLTLSWLAGHGIA
jgi:pimeloyl-ACP methyl ester carboxylesterase